MMVTLKDIAKEVGLNVSVVSRALSAKPDKHAVVAEETKRLIMEAASRMGYQRNRAAEFLKKGKAATLGVFLPEIPNRLIADLMIGISGKAAELGFPLNFFFGTDLADYKKYFSSVNDASHSGIITYPFKEQIASELGNLIDNYKSNGGQIVVLNTEKKYPEIPVLNIDNQIGGYLAAKALISAGCQQFLVDDLYPERADGFGQFLRDKELEFTVYSRGEFSGIFNELCHHKERCLLGVFATSDQYALELYPVIQQHGYSIGNEVKIVGYDNLVLTESVTPSLSTIHQPFREQGERAVEKLVNMIYGKKENDETIKPWLIKRKSTGH